MMLEKFPNLNEWASLRDKVLEKTLETGCRVMVKLSEKTMEFLELAEQHFPQVKEFVSPWIEQWRAGVKGAPCCEEAQPFETPAPLPAETQEEIPMDSEPSVLTPVEESAPPESVSDAVESPAPSSVASNPLAEQLRTLPEEFLRSAFSQNQLLKVLFLMAVSEKKWLLAQEIAQTGEELDFPILPQNIRKVIQQRGVDTGLVRVRERSDSRRGAKEFHLTAKGESYLKSEFHLS